MIKIHSIVKNNKTWMPISKKKKKKQNKTKKEIDTLALLGLRLPFSTWIHVYWLFVKLREAFPRVEESNHKVFILE
jgi:hypothetical protein